MVGNGSKKEAILMLACPIQPISFPIRPAFSVRDSQMYPELNNDQRTLKLLVPPFHRSFRR